MSKKVIALLVAIILVVVITGIIFVVYHQEESGTQNNNFGGTTTNNENVSANIADDLVLIEGGTFQMGSPESEVQRETDEIQYEITVSDFYIGRYEITQSQYGEVMGENPSNFEGKNLPVENITWYDAIEYCNRLSKKD